MWRRAGTAAESRSISSPDRGMASCKPVEVRERAIGHRESENHPQCCECAPKACTAVRWKGLQCYLPCWQEFVFTATPVSHSSILNCLAVKPRYSQSFIYTQLSRCKSKILNRSSDTVGLWWKRTKALC